MTNATKESLAHAGRVVSLATLLAVLALVAAGIVPMPAASQQLTPHLALARLCVNESGPDAYRHADCAAIHAVITWRRDHLPAYRGDTYVDALHRYSGSVTVRREGLGRQWILGLWEAPSRRFPSWERTLEHARDVYAGRVTARCVELAGGEHRAGVVPMTWAAPGVRPAMPARRVDCGASLNDFWVVEQYLARWDS